MILSKAEWNNLTEEERALFYYCKEAVDTLSSKMMEKLWHHRSKGRWDGIEPMKAFRLMMGEVSELLEATLEGAEPDDVYKEAADVANYALIMAKAHEERYVEHQKNVNLIETDRSTECSIEKSEL